MAGRLFIQIPEEKGYKKDSINTVLYWRPVAEIQHRSAYNVGRWRSYEMHVDANHMASHDIW